MKERTKIQPEGEQMSDEKPPFFRSWSIWYAIILSNLALMILLFFAFTKYFD